MEEIAMRRGLSKFLRWISWVCLCFVALDIIYNGLLPLLIHLRLISSEGYVPSDAAENIKVGVFYFVVAFVAEFISNLLAGKRGTGGDRAMHYSRVEADVQVVYLRQGNTIIPVHISGDDVIPVNRRLR
jgi:hypothetical protein